MNSCRPPREVLLSWIALLVLLSVTVLCAYQPLGVFNIVMALAIALTKTLIVALIFMELRGGKSLMVIFAAAGVFWLGIMFWLSLSDFLTRLPHASGLLSG